MNASNLTIMILGDNNNRNVLWAMFKSFITNLLPRHFKYDQQCKYVSKFISKLILLRLSDKLPFLHNKLRLWCARVIRTQSILIMCFLYKNNYVLKLQWAAAFCSWQHEVFMSYVQDQSHRGGSSSNPKLFG